MALLNYTTTIPVSKTVGEIAGILVEHGANAVTTTYDSQRLASGISFTVPTRFGDRYYQLPANIAGVQRVLERAYQNGRIARRYATPEQAARTGWRILKDWVEAQMAIIEAGMVELAEVMTPYMQREPGGPTLYQELVKHEMKLLPERTP